MNQMHAPIYVRQINVQEKRRECQEISNGFDTCSTSTRAERAQARILILQHEQHEVAFSIRDAQVP